MWKQLWSQKDLSLRALPHGKGCWAAQGVVTEMQVALLFVPGDTCGHVMISPPPTFWLQAGLQAVSFLPPRPTGPFLLDQASGQMHMGVKEGREARSSFRASTSLPLTPVLSRC